MIARTDVS